MEAKNYVQILIDSLKKKQEYLQRIVTYNEEQQRIMTNRTFDDNAFQKNLDEKGELVEAILKLDEGFNSTFARVKEEVSANRELYKAEIATLQELIKKVTEFGVRIQAQEARNKQLADARFTSMRKELGNAKVATSRANAYYKNANNINDYDTHFLDQKK